MVTWPHVGGVPPTTLITVVGPSAGGGGGVAGGALQSEQVRSHVYGGVSSHVGIIVVQICRVRPTQVGSGVPAGHAGSAPVHLSFRFTLHAQLLAADVVRSATSPTSHCNLIAQAKSCLRQRHSDGAQRFWS